MRTGYTLCLKNILDRSLLFMLKLGMPNKGGANMRTRGPRLSQSLEDYLEIIADLEKEENGARITDIARSLGVAKASASEAVGILCQRGLAFHKRYGRVHLTEEGRKLAGEVRRAHRVLYEFIRDILGLPEEVAERDSCQMEHALSSETLGRIVKFLDFIKNCPHGEPDWLKHFHHFLRTGEYTANCHKGVKGMVAVSKLNAGTKGVIRKIEASGRLLQRLLQMGLGEGVEFEIVRVAPLGDPVELRVRGYNLSLRRQEAEALIAEVMDDAGTD